MAQKFNDYSLAADAYAAFDALSLKSLIVKRLNDTKVFTDQNFEGSNISAFIDIIAYAYHVLLFYLNQTSSESTFTTAQLYENINKIVKLINYKPVGYQSAILPFKATSNNILPAGIYTIPRYSYFTLNGINYTFTKDTTFSKLTNDFETLVSLQDENVLFQGSVNEYPTYTAIGNPFESLTLTIVDNNGRNIVIDHFNIDVYVKDNTVVNPVWEKWSPTESLYLERSNSKTYEIRMNEDERYEIKFGNGINGKKLTAGDSVAVYYLRSDGATGEVGPGVLNNNTLFYYRTPRAESILADTVATDLNLLPAELIPALTFSNTDPSTPFITRESVQNIKANASNTFRSQYRLITVNDFENYINKNYNNLLASVKVVNNWDYLTGHMKYYFDMGVNNPTLESRVLYNQVKFADSCNFNNIYVYAVPRLEKLTSYVTRTNYLNSALKQLIINDVQPIKLATAEVIINDPVYVAVDFGIRSPGEALNSAIAETSYLEITRDVFAKRNAQSIQNSVYNILKNYFSTTRDNLGSVIKITDLTNAILSIEGVKDINTKRRIGNTIISTPGISLLVYNPIYPEIDISIVSQNTQLPYFKFPYIHNVLEFVNKISVVTPSLQQVVPSEY